MPTERERERERERVTCEHCEKKFLQLCGGLGGVANQQNY